MRLASSSHPCSNRLNGNGSARLYEERSAVHVTATMLPVTIPTIFFLIVANSDSIVTTADKQADSYNKKNAVLPAFRKVRHYRYWIPLELMNQELFPVKRNL